MAGQCQHCGSTLPPQGRGRPRKWCNPTCREAARLAGCGLTCAQCAAPMWPHPSTLPQGQAICRTCRRENPKPRYTPKPLDIRACERCRRVYETRIKTQRYCSEECRRPGRAPRAPTTKRGYGSAHQRLRGEWATVLEAAGSVPCARCTEPIEPSDAWHLDHADDRSGYYGPSHAACNLAAGARRRNRREFLAS